MIGSGYLTFGIAKVGWPTHSPHTATMLLPDSGGLVPHSKVLLSGIRIGQVTDVDRDATGVSITMRIDGQYGIPAAGPVSIENLSALGEPYIEFTPTATGEPYLPDGARIEAARVSRPMSMSDLAQQATALLQQVDPDTVNSVVSTLVEGFAGSEAVMPQLARSTQLLAATLLSRTDTIRRMLVDLQAHADDMSWTGPALSEAAGPWAAFGPKVGHVIDSFAKIIQKGDVPADYTIDKPDEIGLIPLLNQLSSRVTRMGPDMLALLPVMSPMATSGANALRHLDISALIEQALQATSADGALQLQVNVK
nr:MlaD family protein [Nocardia sp. BSTN01]